MHIHIGAYTDLTDYTPYYSYSAGGLDINEQFDGTTRSATATFTLYDLPSMPQALSVVEIFSSVDDTDILFSGVVRSLERTLEGAIPALPWNSEEEPDPLLYNGASVVLNCDSWEVASGGRGELIIYESYYSKTSHAIISDIVTKYLPHIDPSLIDVGEGITLEKIVLINRKPIDAIVDICKLCALSWWIRPLAIASPDYYAGQLELFTPGGVELVSPVTLSDQEDEMSDEHLSRIGLKLTTNLDELFNDLYLRAKAIKANLVQETIQTDGWTGSYNLAHKPFGLSTMIPILDEFNSTDEIGPDTGKWNYQGNVGIDKTLFVQDGRLQMVMDFPTDPAAIVSKRLVHTKQPLKARILEISLRNMVPGAEYAFGFHDGTDQLIPDSSKIILGVKLKWLDVTHAQIYMVKNGVDECVGTEGDFTVDITGVGTETPYQFILTLFSTSNLAPFTNDSGWPVANDIEYRLWVNGGAYGDLAEPATHVLTSGTITLQTYAAFCPAMTTGGVLGSVIQGSVSVTPEVLAYVYEVPFISKGELIEGGQYTFTCPHSNWEKYDMRGEAVKLWGFAGSYWTTIQRHTENTFTVNDIGTLELDTIYKAEIDWRRAEVGIVDTNDYTTNLIVTPDDNRPTVQFYAEEVISGWIHIYYCAEKDQSVRVTDVQSVSDTATQSGIPHDLGYRKKFEELPDALFTLREMLSYAEEMLQPGIVDMVQGSISTHSYLLGGEHLHAGMTQAVDLRVGREVFTTTSYISSLSIKDTGAHQLGYSVNLGGLTGFFRERFIAKLKSIHATGLVIDDLSNEERADYDVVREVNGTDPTKDIHTIVGSPVVSLTEFDVDGITLLWTRSDVNKPTPTVTGWELRTDTAFGTTGKGLLQQGTYTGDTQYWSLAKGSIVRRKYTFYIYDIDADGVYSYAPTILTLDNKQPIPAPFEDIQVMEKGLIAIKFGVPYGVDITKRVLVISNQELNEYDIVNYTTSEKVDLYYEYEPYNYVFEELRTQKITAYDKILYFYHFDMDEYSHLDSRFTHYDQVINSNYVCKPPKVPTCHFYDESSDETLQENQVKVEVDREFSEDFGEPETFHVQLHSEATFPSHLNRVGPTQLYAENANDSYMYVKEGEVTDDDIGKLLVIVDEFDVDGTTYPWYQGRYISGVRPGKDIDGTMYDKIAIDGNVYKDAAWYDYEVWDLWYDNCDGGYYNFNASLENLSVLSNKYTFTFTSNVEFVGYIRVYAVNKYGLIAPCTADFVSTSEIGLDTDQAPKASSFSIVRTPYVLQDGSAGCYITFNWMPPTIEPNNFSHVLIFMGVETESDSEVLAAGVEAGTGMDAGGSVRWQPIGEYWESGQPWITQATNRTVHFACVSINGSGWYDEQWYENGYYLEVVTTLAPEETPPLAPDYVLATYVPQSGAVQVLWPHAEEPDVKYYRVSHKEATTEGGLLLAEWGTEEITRSTGAYHVVGNDLNGYWFRFRVRADDMITEAVNTNFTESNNVQAFSGAAFDPPPVLTPPLTTSKIVHTEAGVTYIDFALDWTIPTGPDSWNYGGVWIVAVVTIGGGDPMHQVRTRVDRDKDETLLTFIADPNTTVKFQVFPANISGLVDLTTLDYLESAVYTLDASGVSMLPPELTAQDDLNNVVLNFDVPPVTSQQNFYAAIEVWVGTTSDPGDAEKLVSWPIAHTSASNEDWISWNINAGLLTQAIDAGRITCITTFAYGVNYYWFAKLLSRFDGLASDLSTGVTAMFIDPTYLGDPLNPITDPPEFSLGTMIAAEWIRDCATNQVMVFWNSPDVNEETIFKAEIQISAYPFVIANMIAVDTAVACTGAGSATFYMNHPGAIYCRIRWANNTTSGVAYSDWYGHFASEAYKSLPYSGSSTTLDSYFIRSANVIIGNFTQSDGSDTPLDLPVKVNTVTNTNQFWNICVEMSNSAALLVDEVVATGTATWQTGDKQIEIAGYVGTPTDWTGYWFLYVPDPTYPRRQLGGLISNAVQVGANWRLNLNICPGKAQTSIAFSIVKPLWCKTTGTSKVFFKNLCPAWDSPNASPYMVPNVDYPVLNPPFSSGETVYVRARADNGYGWGEWTTVTSRVVDAAVAQTVGYTMSYQLDDPPQGTLASIGGVWSLGPNGTVQYNLTFRYTQSAINIYRADSFVVLIKAGGGSGFAPDADPKMVFATVHTTGYQDYNLPIAGLEIFRKYSFRVYAAKTTVSGTVKGSSYIQIIDTQYNISNSDLVLVPRDVGGHVAVKTYDYGTVATLECAGLYRMITAPFNAAIGLLADGSISISPSPTAFNLTLYGNVSVFNGNSYLTPLQLGDYRLWVDSSGRLRIKFGAPASDTDGTVVGTQS